MYDVIFMCYKEPDYLEHYKLLKEKAPHAKIVKGVKGIDKAHQRCAKVSDTSMLYIVDGDAKIIETFHFDFEPPDEDHVYMWKSINPVNGIVSAHGSVKLYPTNKLKTKTKDWFLDFNMCKFSNWNYWPNNNPDYKHWTSIRSVEEISNITEFNTDPFNAFKAAFKQTVKYNYWIHTIPFQHVHKDWQKIIDIWCTKGDKRLNGSYSMSGAQCGVEFFEENKAELVYPKGNMDRLHLINDYVWLKEQFDLRHE